MISKTLCFIAEAHLALDRHAKVKDVARRAADLAQEVGDLQLRATSLSLLGAAEHGDGELPLAITLQQEALATLTEHTSRPLETEIRRLLDTPTRQRATRPRPSSSSTSPCPWPGRRSWDGRPPLVAHHP